MLLKIILVRLAARILTIKSHSLAAPKCWQVVAIIQLTVQDRAAGLKQTGHAKSEFATAED